MRLRVLALKGFPNVPDKKRALCKASRGRALIWRTDSTRQTVGSLLRGAPKLNRLAGVQRSSNLLGPLPGHPKYVKGWPFRLFWRLWAVILHTFGVQAAVIAC